MAIQIPNPGTGNGASGDNEFVLWSKVKDNFTDQTNAASRLVGVGSKNIPDVSNLNRAILVAPREGTMESSDEYDTHKGGEYRYTNVSSYTGSSKIPTYLPATWHQYSLVTTKDMTGGRLYQEAVRTTGFNGGVLKLFRVMNIRNEWSDWHHEWTTANTMVDSSGFIKKASPVLRVFSDRIEGNEDGDKLNAKFVKKGVGDYLIKGTTGLSDEGWYIEIPRDANGNNLVAVEYESLENGDVSLKTYKRKFDFETVSIVADHDNPLDIPETRWVDLRFNDIEVAHEPIE